MTDKQYRDLDAESQSDIKLFKENRKEYEYVKILGLGEKKETKSMSLGTLNHCLLFENEEFHNRYAHFDGITPSSTNQKKFLECMVFMSMEDAYANSYSIKGLKPTDIIKKANDLCDELYPYIDFMSTNGHKELITPEDELLSRRMVEIVYNHEGVRKTLLADRHNPEYDNYKEFIIQWLHHTSPERDLKSKIDELCVDVKNQIAYAYDYKTTNSKNMKSFISSIKYYEYDLQASFYIEAIKTWLRFTYGLDFQVVFRFIPQLNVAPYNVLDVIELEDADLEAAYCVWTTELAELVECRKTGNFDNPSAYTESGVNKVSLGNNTTYVMADAF